LLLLLCCQVTHSSLRKEGKLICPGCRQAGCVKGDGLRKDHNTVLDQPKQFWMFSFNLVHVGCSQIFAPKPSECVAAACSGGAVAFAYNCLLGQHVPATGQG
jgi:hypothetical protein